jgi:hypothetical protein
MKKIYLPMILAAAAVWSCKPAETEVVEIPVVEEANSKKRGFDEITPLIASADDEDEGEESEYDSEEEREEVK